MPNLIESVETPLMASEIALEGIPITRRLAHFVNNWESVSGPVDPPDNSEFRIEFMEGDRVQLHNVLHNAGLTRNGP